MRLSSVSLFSGCMGLDLGLERAGIQAKVCVEKDPVCRLTIELNRPGLPVFEDVFTVTGAQLRQRVGGRPDLVVGGPPCQSFSTIGKRGAMADKRGMAMLEYVRLVGELRPRAFIMENVRGLLSVEKGDLMRWLMDEFKHLGYHVSWKLVNAVDYGVPQARHRVIMIGARAKVVTLPTGQLVYRSLRSAIADLAGNPGPCGAFSPRMKALLDKVPPGGNWKSLSKSDQKLAMGNANLKSGGLTPFYRRLSWDKPCPTLLTSPTQRATPLCHPDVTRPLSISEYRRIQGFPDSWKLAGSNTQQYRQLGNAVPVELARIIGEAVKETL